MADGDPKGLHAPSLIGPFGPGIDRVDGRLKVTGHATYAYEYGADEYHGPAPLVGFIVPATIARGRIVSIDAKAAEAAPGVRLVLTHANAPAQAPWGPLDAQDRFARAKPELGSDMIRHYGEPVAFVVADSFEQARAAAMAIRVEYAPDAIDVDLLPSLGNGQLLAKMDGGEKPQSSVGDATAAFAKAPVRIDVHYDTPYQNHAQMEPHASLAKWDGPKLTIWCSSQMVDSHQAGVAATLQMSKTNVRIVSRYIGGGFGGKLPYFSDQILAALAAKRLGHPVKVALTRQQMFHLTSHRTQTFQHLRIGAGHDGTLQSVSHDAWIQTARYDNFVENVAQPTRGLYASPNISTLHKVVKLDLPPSDSMRAPGDAVGSLSLECALDELADATGVDPVALRLRNDTMVDPTTHEPFTSRKLAQCLTAGAAKFGWDKRPAKPGTQRDGEWLIGYGMASAYRGNMLRNASAEVTLAPDGHLTVRLAMTDIGTGTYTILTQIAAESMGLPVGQVTVLMGDTNFPPTAGSGGSFGAETSGSAVFRACENLRGALAKAAIADVRSPLHGVDADGIVFENGRIASGSQGEPLGALAGRMSPDGVFAKGQVSKSEKPKGKAQASFGAHFAEVGVNAITGEVRMRRMVGVFAVGRVLNVKTLTSQLMGGMIWGLSSALTEENVVDTRIGKFANQDLANYHVPIQADVGSVEVSFLPETDDLVNPIGVKGGGELGICGSGAAIGNAVFNATGVRIRSFPITPDKLIPHLPALKFV
ncbi:xanthine dehydrogenase family protein molybdopterin-binding subunit [Lichenicola cladoniae]|uniref:Xanthine dehydrogenase family protein molybdopterin-binding subunit n=1 Tax=Lichenicola cladoniae TaxID=1484109 RepID=A0A6M8HNQ1_9PROT|nr:xanthine dehydrogenase family protein molybdopterin-binding subunit [Lichenicola cladoniae]NPD67436.1 xanthine dehydrogenase family protein molybdopterin-binding subunit [Acetobacteraceae bacterium]QKE89925.1 xanthine dehydrogenase family protein molybdopterin-binding subunit [Lichenicola cladoniae]